MSGDPLRSKFIAENCLENSVFVNNVREVNGYTGTYKGKRVSVMASGMGQPSISIYSYYMNATASNKKALCVLTVSDSFVNPEDILSAQERETSLMSMIDTALNIA